MSNENIFINKLRWLRLETKIRYLISENRPHFSSILSRIQILDDEEEKSLLRASIELRSAIESNNWLMKF